MAEDRDILWRWTGEHLEPIQKHAKRADDVFVIGELYRLDVVEEQQHARDKAFHADLRKNVYRNLPEDTLADRLTYDDFRHWCLIKCGFYTEKVYTFGTNRDARECLGVIEETPSYKIVNLTGSVITVWRAKSQKIKHGMPKEERLRSYAEVRDFAYGLINATPPPPEYFGAERRG